MKSERPFKQKMSVSLDEDIVFEIRELAEKDERNFSQYVNKVLRAHINEQNSDK